MVSKKASADDVKKTAVQTAADENAPQSAATKRTASKQAVSKTAKENASKTAKSSAAKTAKVSAAKAPAKSGADKASAAKNTVKAAAKTSASKKTAKAADSKETNIPEAENHDIISEVMTIKSRNEEKKAAKPAAAQTAKKAAAKSMPAEGVEEKGRKAVPENSKRAAVKENAKIAEAKKFLEMKESADAAGNVSENGESELCGGAFCAWARAYKNLFNFKGRTSRFEFWSSMLINMFVILLLVSGVAFAMPHAHKITTVLAILFYIAEVFFYLSLFVRRLHDAGYGAWKGFFRPFVLYWLLTGILSAAGTVYALQGGKIYSGFSTGESFIILGCGAATLLVMMFYGYYSLKIFIAAGFFEEERGANQYGTASFYDAGHKAKSLRYAAIYLLFLLVGYLTYFMSTYMDAVERGGYNGYY